MSLQSNPPLSHSVKALKGILIHTSLTILWAPVSMHLALQAAALLSDLKDAERLVHLKHEFCQLCKLFLKKLLLYKHCPADNPTPPQSQQCHEQGQFKKHKDHGTEKKSVRWSFLLHPFIPICGFAHILWRKVSAEHVQTLTPNKPKAQGGVYKPTLIQICTDSKEKLFDTWSVNYKTSKSHCKWP